jgi:hypothetical protein
MHVVRRRRPRPDVEELPDAGLRHEVLNRPPEERAVLPCPGPRVGHRLQQRLDSLPVRLKVVFAAE